MKLLQLPTIALEQRIKEEMELNPALEEGKEDTPGDEYPDTPDAETGSEDGGDTSYDSLSDYLNEDDIPDYKLQENNRSKGEQAEEIPFSDATSFYETLRQQLGEHLADRRAALRRADQGHLDRGRIGAFAAGRGPRRGHDGQRRRQDQRAADQGRTSAI